ncbi:MAG: diguanylate cyclase [Gaiella sp.]
MGVSKVLAEWTARVGVPALVVTHAAGSSLFGGRRRRTEPDPTSVAVSEMRDRLDALARDLREALERSEADARRNRLLAQLTGSVDLETLLTTVLDAAVEEGGFDAGQITLDDPGGTPITVARALVAEEASTAHPLGPGPLTGTMIVSYRFMGHGPVAADELRGAVLIPLRGREGQALGTVSLYWRREPEPDAGRVGAAEEVLALATSALENARRLREARHAAETDGLTGLYNQRHFHELLRREVQRAQRYGRSLALIVFDLDDLKAINDRLGHLTGDAVISHVGDRLRDAGRSVDIACRIGGDEFAVILPESSGSDAELLYSRVQSLAAESPVAPGVPTLRLSAGIAELRHGDTAPSLFDRADAALYQAKRAGKGRVDVSGAHGPTDPVAD